LHILSKVLWELVLWRRQDLRNQIEDVVKMLVHLNKKDELKVATNKRKNKYRWVSGTEQVKNAAEDGLVLFIIMNKRQAAQDGREDLFDNGELRRVGEISLINKSSYLFNLNQIWFC
jgi:hypothetical protein